MQASGIELVIALYQFVILLFSLSVHESAHAWMASRMGDYTARLEGRITLNPQRHIDLIGTIIYPALMIFGPLIGFGGGGIVFGWGKPVPVITRNLKHITRQDNIIALAGPAANLLLALCAFLVMVVLAFVLPGGRSAVIGAVQGQIFLGAASAPQAIAMLLWLMIEVNLALFFFNFLPIPPLDASRIVRNLLPYNALNTFDTIGRFGFIIIFILGRFVVGIFLGPALHLILSLLALVLGVR
ncbi:MAG TPA: site-2 protease family protein [Acidobacteriaceae bacterium]|nr:site-2 protease family protein [Acidobacteriaceae bacterium]